ncbi:hypothetical protein CAPTEDRAFT_203383 [Capitella teleta]|uniref:Alpha-macroglobulin-like TED domain-containing protein n=1 Tax=Capitella teleta TaxID=283909 RepID=R7VGJ1_CAPTE|nr:hypothetical protein CAPTEDRAFT_203383 [Capitella teleta]|eukprot:ELU15436.1 hypothetical protein CAPTEDRAFT_203383 [Capitella teleta]
MIILAILVFGSAIATESRILDGTLETASDKGIEYIAQFVDDYGNFSAPFVTDNDLCFFFKLPLILSTAGKLRQANLVLNYIKMNFMQPDGDFRTSQSVKACFPYGTYYTYTNVWITMAAHSMGRYDVSVPALEFLQPFFRAFTTSGPPSDGHTLTEMFTASHLGNLALLTGDRKAAKKAAKVVMKIMSMQPNLNQTIYYKLDRGNLVTDASQVRGNFFVNRTAPNQPYLFVAYSADFLVKLYMQTEKKDYLDLAKQIISWLSTCHPSIYQSDSTKKVAVAAAWLAALTGDEDAKFVAEAISSYLVSTQNDDGSFPESTLPGNTPEISYALRLVDAVY